MRSVIAQLKKHLVPRRERERGFVAIEFVAGLGFLLVPCALLVIAFPTWAERQNMARTAAREAARVYALTDDAAAAQKTAQEIGANYGLAPGDITIELGEFPQLPVAPGDTVSATVRVKVPALNIALLEIDSAQFTITAEHDEPVDVYRSRAVQ